MKKYIFILYVCILFPVSRIFGQTTTDGLNTSTVITIDLSDDNPKPDKIFPFDKPFVIRLKNIKESYNYVSIRISTNKKAIVQIKSKAALPLADLDGNDLVLQWDRVPGSKATVGDLYSFGTLPPNSAYVVAITPGTKTPLTSDQEEYLIATLSDNTDINNIINLLINESKANASEVLLKSRDEINELAKIAVEKADPNYNYGKPDLKGLIMNLGNFYSISRNIGPELLATKKRFTSPTTLFNRLDEQIKAIDWGAIAKEDSEYNKLIETIDALDKESKNTANASAISADLELLKEEINSAIDIIGAIRQSLIEDVIVKNTFTVKASNTTYDANFLNNSKSYITLDIGAAYVGKVDRISWYTGINIFLRPVDKSIPLSSYHGLKNQLLVRTSILIGVSLASIEKENVRKGLIDDKALVLGAGFRVWSFLKINGGFFCHYRYDQNPVVDLQRYHFSTSPFVSFSIDADVKTLFSGISQSIFK